ncbi:prolipoprotein diacylglyceryl transferase [Paenibacillus antri]|uniref:Prolipoprotein diacylglyceryl transferase n=1 Tax=Paenibacillus antri TaxID=2582848 RepID=A0A5R9G112_9BACL|nr:prolipoprotein diacylglyceryl transferase family protein [Paenibacillus antri]TLS50017.1 prolipoprotein diacylglyceryl transferase [Paenibacillus antri]
MPEVITLGPFMIQGILLKWAIAGVVGFQALKVFAKRKGLWDQRISDLIFQALFIVIIAWKVSPIVTNFPEIMRSPVSFLIIPGTREGLWLGFFISAMYVMRGLRKQNMNGWLFADLVVLGLIASITVFNVLGWRYGVQTSLPWGITITDRAYRYHPINVYMIIASFTVLIWTLKRPLSKIGQGIVAADAMLLLGVGMFIVSFFQPELFQFFGLSLTQWVALSFAILGVALSGVRQRVRSATGADE